MWHAWPPENNERREFFLGKGGILSDSDWKAANGSRTKCRSACLSVRERVREIWWRETREREREKVHVASVTASQ